MRKLYLFIAVLTISRACGQDANVQHILQNMKDHQYALALEAIFGMGMRLQKLLDTTSNENFVVSPLSTTAVIGQLLLGAEGDFRDQLYDLLSLSRSNNSIISQRYNNNDDNRTYLLRYGKFHIQMAGLLKYLQKKRKGELYTLVQSNALFYNHVLELKEYFKLYMNDFYETELHPLDFNINTASIINDWASSRTNGLIKKVIERSPQPSTSAIFLNSIYFNGEWENPFPDEFNREDRFFINENESVNVTFMTAMVENIPFIETERYRVVCLPYKNKELGMYIIYPNRDSPVKYNIKKFIQGLETEELLSAVSKMKLHDAVIKIPKLSLSNTLHILEPLKKYAVFKQEQDTVQKSKINGNVIDELHNKIESYKNFTTSRKSELILTGAANGADLVVSDIVQQMVFSINEKGTEAAAITAGIIDYMGGSKTVVLDRPFSFFIRHEATLATIFWGTINNPSTN